MAKVLFVGIAAVDIVNIVSQYPPEDAEVRAMEQIVRRGGNAANSAVICAQLGHETFWIGTLADDAEAQIIATDFSRFGVHYTQAACIPDSHTPTSYITLSQQTGSRTIVHYRKLPELSAAHFQQVNPGDYDWIHFEGRNVPDTMQMMRAIASMNVTKPLVSVEIEKQRDDIESLLPFSNLALFSKDYVMAQQADAVTYLRAVQRKHPHLDLIAAWGEQGAWILHRDDVEPKQIPIPKKITPVDSVGAGDTFNAALISALLNNKKLEEAVLFAHGIAASKCQRIGFDLSG